MIKLTWKVTEKPSGRYRSFTRRTWPMAYYAGTTEVAANISCSDDYVPGTVKSGNHSDLSVSVADHSQTPWKWRKLKNSFKTIEEAKAAAVRCLEQNPSFTIRA